MNIIIRKENTEDYKKTEYMAMRSFWNRSREGCNEHLLVRILREAPEYEPELSRVAELDGEIVGVIMYFRAMVKSEDETFEVLSFGPLCVEPTIENSGIGKMLLEESIKAAKETNYPGIVIFGEPDYYPKRGFCTCDKYGITDSNGNNFDAFMCLPLNEEAFSKVHGKFYEPALIEKCEDTELLAKMNTEFPFHKPLFFRWFHDESFGRVCECKKNYYIIKFWEKEIRGKLNGSFYNEEKELPVVGDYVVFKHNPCGESLITEVLERKSTLKRPDQSGHAIGYVKTMQEQVMIANVDYVFIVTSLNDNYNINRIARYVSITLQGNAIPVVILTKMDECSNPGRYISEVEDLSDKVKVHAISALYGIGLDELEQYLTPGVTIALLGSSGVGKSTLVNTIAGQEIMKTGDIRENDSKGRHTTTHRQMIMLDNEVTFIDTPGMREIGMCDVDEGIDETFSDIAELKTRCKFSDCRHETEPGCAIKAAILDGTLSQERYNMYLQLMEESMDSASLKARKQDLMIQVSKFRKTLKAKK